MTPAGRIATLIVALVLVGTAELQRKGATNIRCGWTGYANGSSVTVTCRGTMGSSSVDSLHEELTGTVAPSG